MANLSNINNKFLVTTGGNVGIGTTSPIQKLDTPNIIIGGSTIAGGIYRANSTMIDNLGGIARFYSIGPNTTTGGSYQFNSLSSNATAGAGTVMTIFNTGNVGIATAININKLDVGGNINVQGGNGSYLTFNNGDANIVINNNGSGRDLSFKTYSGSSNAERMRIDKDGNVGIGTISPATKLQVSKAGEVIVRSSMTAADGYRGGFEADNQHTGGTIWSMFSTNNSDGYFGGGKYVIANESMGGVDANTAAKFVIDGGGSVGIGTTSPTKQLHLLRTTGDVRGIMVETTVATSYAEVQVKAAREFRIGTGGSSTAPNGQFYIYDATAGAHRFDIAANGNIGIGTTSPSANLEIVTAVGADAIRMNYGQSADIFLGFSSANPRILLQDNSNVITHDFTSNANNYIVGSNVGIGTTTPSKKLEVAGSYKLGTNGYIQYNATYPYTITTANTASVGNLVFSAGLGSAPYESKIELQGSNTAGAAGITLSTASTPRITVTADGKIGLRKTDPYYDVDATELGANSYAWGSGLAIFGQDRYNIRELNNLFYSANTRCAGIGSSSNLQSDMFDGNFDSAYAIGANTTYVVEIDGTGVMNMTYPQGYAVISFYYIYNNYTSLTGEQYHYSGTYSGQWRAMGAATNIRGSAGTGGRVVRLNSAGNNYVNKWRFTFVTGSTGINVADIAFFTSRDAGAQVNTYMRGDRTSEWTRTIRFRNDANAVVGSIAPGSTSTSFNTSSDYRLKEDLKDFAGLNMISKIPVYSFKWINKDKRSHGVLAHELEKVLPQAVTGEKDAKKTQVVDYSKIVPLLIKAIQELKAEIDELKK